MTTRPKLTTWKELLSNLMVEPREIVNSENSVFLVIRKIFKSIKCGSGEIVSNYPYCHAFYSFFWQLVRISDNIN